MEKAKRVAALSSAYSLAIVFLWAGASKAASPAAFREAILGFRIVGEAVATALAYYVPWVEILAGLAVLSRATRGGALVVLGSLLTVFSLALLLACARGIDPSCGCFGEAGRAGCGIPIARNALLMSMVAVALGGAGMIDGGRCGEVRRAWDRTREGRDDVF